jgi:serine/threonine protein kinase
LFYLAKDKSTLPEDVIIQYLYQTLSILDSLHQNGYTHQDIRPDNIFINLETNNVKLTDVGVNNFFFQLGYNTELQKDIVFFFLMLFFFFLIFFVFLFFNFTLFLFLVNIGAQKYLPMKGFLFFYLFIY